MDQREELARLIDPTLSGSDLTQAYHPSSRIGRAFVLADRILAAGWEKRSPAGEADKVRADRAEERLRELAVLFNVPDGGCYLNDWKERAERYAALSVRPAGERVDLLAPIERERVRQHQEYDQIATAVEHRPPSDGPTLLSIVERLAPDPSVRASQPSPGEVEG